MSNALAVCRVATAYDYHDSSFHQYRARMGRFLLDDRLLSARTHPYAPATWTPTMLSAICCELGSAFGRAMAGHAYTDIEARGCSPASRLFLPRTLSGEKSLSEQRSAVRRGNHDFDCSLWLWPSRSWLGDVPLGPFRAIPGHSGPFRAIPGHSGPFRAISVDVVAMPPRHPDPNGRIVVAREVLISGSDCRVTTQVTLNRLPGPPLPRQIGPRAAVNAEGQVLQLGKLGESLQLLVQVRHRVEALLTG